MTLSPHQLWNLISPRFRSLFYSLPLFVQWWPALYFEKDKEALKKADTAFCYSIFFFGGLFCIFIVYTISAIFEHSLNPIIYYIIYAFHSIWGILYLSLSLLLCYEIISKKKLYLWQLRVSYPEEFINSIKTKFK